MSEPKIGDFVWHVHHEVLLESLTEPIDNRVAYIRTEKDASEVETRLRLMKPVRDPSRLPKKLVEAGKACFEAWKAYVEAGKAYVEARTAYIEAGKACFEAWKAYVEARTAYIEAGKAYVEARTAYIEAGKAHVEAWEAYVEARTAYVEAGKDPAVLALHAEECPNCPWNGRTIFP